MSASWKSRSRQRSHGAGLLCVDYCEKSPTIMTWLLHYCPTCLLPAPFHFIVRQHMGVSYLWKHADLNQAQRFRKQAYRLARLPYDAVKAGLCCNRSRLYISVYSRVQKSKCIWVITQECAMHELSVWLVNHTVFIMDCSGCVKIA